MTQQQKTATLTTIFSDVLANLAFMFTDDEPDEAPAGGAWLETTISYRGPLSGTLRLQCPRPFSKLLAANLLGLDSEDAHAEAEAIDAVKEFMNVVCGQFVTTMHGSDDVFDLSIPEVRELPEAPETSEDDGENVSMLFAEGHCVRLLYAPRR